MNLREMTRRILKPDPRAADASGSAAQIPGPAVLTPTDEESLGRELLNLDWGLGLFRWVHLANALDRTPGVKRVLSIGSGGGLHEAFLARTRPALDVTGADQREPSVARDLPNLRFLTGDLLEPAFRATLPRADFIYSIECLEHIEDDRTVARAMADLLAPGGSLYLQLPFASAAEQADPLLCETERRNHGHVRPGYDGDGLRRLAESLGLEVELVACAFWVPLQPMLWASTEKFGPLLAPHWREVLALVSGDLREGVAPDRTRATAIKVLARKPA
jgi:SAM-dependent methyltransferase